MKQKIVIASLLVSYILVAVIAFFSGRSISDVKVIQKEGKTVTDTIYSERLVPYEVLTPIDPKLPIKKDTIWRDSLHIKEVVMKVDTSKIISEYIKLNKYKAQGFDNDNGKLEIDAEVQYNTLSRLSYTFTPIQKEVIRQRTIVPFISTSYNSFKFVEAGGGVFINNFGVEAKYVTDFSRNGFEVGIKYKF